MITCNIQQQQKYIFSAASLPMRKDVPGTSIKGPSLAHTLPVNEAVYFSVEGNIFSRSNTQQMVHKSVKAEAILGIR
jgi:hypothetical protein